MWPTDDLVAATARALDGPPPPSREPALDLVYGVRHGAALAASDAIVDWLARVPVAV